MAQAEQAALHAQLEQARARLDGLLRELRGIDRELEGLSKERPQYELLAEVCNGLEELAALGAAELFWGERFTEGNERLGSARGRVDGFQRQLKEIEDRRQQVFAKVQDQQESAEFLEDDLLDVQRREEERKLEWLIEREDAEFPVRQAVMPWAHGGEADRRFRKSLALAIALSLLLGALLPLIDLPLPERWEVIEVPDRLARLIQTELPPPPPLPAREKLQPEETVPSEEIAQPAEEAAPKQTESRGILAFREKFSGLAESKATAKLGAEASIRSAAASASGRSARSMVTTQALGSSGGVNLAALSRDVGGAGESIEGVEVARVTSSIGGIVGEERPLADGPRLGRTDEEIQIVFDRHKAGLYRLYNRELRRDPTLKGQMVLRLRIEPDGSVSLCELQGTDMDAPQLSAQVLVRVQTFDFGAKDDIPAITILYPIDFLPAT